MKKQPKKPRKPLVVADETKINEGAISILNSIKSNIDSAIIDPKEMKEFKKAIKKNTPKH